MKFLLLLLVIGVAVWLIIGRRRGPPPTPKTPPRPAEPAEPAAMLACAHCGVHVPQAETVMDAAGRPYCGALHRLAGPR